MKEKIRIAVLSLGICTLLGMTFAISSRNYQEKERVPKLNSASVSSAAVSNFVCSSTTLSDSSQATKEYNRNIIKLEQSLNKIDSLGGNTITLEDPCEGLKGKKKTECNINNIELRSTLRQVRNLKESISTYELCLEKFGFVDTEITTIQPNISTNSTQSDTSNTSPSITDMAKTDMPIYDSLPISTAPVSNRGVSTISTSFTPGSNDYWARDGLTQRNERNVFKASFRYDDPNDRRDWEIRLGRSGQLYSVRTTEIGELVGKQHTHEWSFSRWNDAVIQTVLTNTEFPRKTVPGCRNDDDCENPNLVTNKNIDMNQGGAYIRDGLIEPFYSPLLRFNISADETRSIIWTPVSALPTTYQPGILYDQRMKMLNNGVIEVTQLITNFGDIDIDRVNIPWAILNGDALDTLGYYDNSGNYQELSAKTNWLDNIINTEETNGIVRVLDSGKNYGISFMLGNKEYNTTPKNSNGPRIHPSWRKSDIRLGKLTRSRWPDGFYNYSISTRRSVMIKPGESMFFRYYIAIGFQDNLEDAHSSYNTHANYGVVRYTETTAGQSRLRYVCQKTSGEFSANHCTARDASFALYDYPVVNAKPVFVLENSSGQNIYTHDPYALSKTNPNDPDEPVRFYNGSTQFKELLGWAVPQEETTLEAKKYISPLDNRFNGAFQALDGYLFRTPF